MDPKIHHNNLIPSILAKIQANAAGADDALMLDHRGFLAETNATHVFLVARGQVLTSHPVACPGDHPGRRDRASARPTASRSTSGDLSLTEVHRADEVFCTGTMGELAAVTKVDGRVIGDGQVGPVSRRLTELFRARTAVEGVRVVD
ncbi:MAG: aminotransferase class IV [Isosphaeraceae bacterium]